MGHEPSLYATTPEAYAAVMQSSYAVRVALALAVLSSLAGSATAQTYSMCRDFIATMDATGNIVPFMNQVYTAMVQMDDRDMTRGCQSVVPHGLSGDAMAANTQFIRQYCSSAPGDTMYGVAGMMYRLARANAGVGGDARGSCGY